MRPAEGGIRAHLLTLLQHLQDEFTFTVACPPGQAADFGQSGCSILPVPLGGRLHPYYDLQAARGLFRATRLEKYSMVHAHGFKAALLSRPVARCSRIPCLVTVHGDLAHGGTAKHKKFVRLTERVCSRWAHGYVAVSHWLSELLTADFHVPAHKIAVIPNGIEVLHTDSVCGALPFADGQPLVGTVARLAPQKGIEYFIHSAARLTEIFPDVRFVVVGAGPQRAELEELCRTLHLTDRVYFSGFRKDVPALLKRFTVFVQPSLSEGQGITVLEAMASGCPVVATAVGGLRELICDGQNGLLVPPQDPAALARAVAVLLQNEQMRLQLACEGKKRVENYSVPEMIGQTRELYRRVLEGKWPS